MACKVSLVLVPAVTKLTLNVLKSEKDEKNPVAKTTEVQWPDFAENSTIDAVARGILNVHWSDFYTNNAADFAHVSQTIARLEAESKMPSYPLRKNIFNAFKINPASIKCIILGQDPYPGLNSDGNPAAQGYSFSTAKNVKLQPSLALIYEELLDSKMITSLPNHGDIASSWSPQGVMLFNAALTVQAGKPKSHVGPWSGILLKTLNYIAETRARSNKKCIIMLWGGEARKIATHRQFPNSFIVLEAGHPSPLNRSCRQRGTPNAFLGCGHFAKCNALLKAQGDSEIDWNVK